MIQRIRSAVLSIDRRWMSRLVLTGAVVAAVFGAVTVQAAFAPPVSLAASPTVYVFPIPGGRVAAPSTQLTFRGVSPSAIGSPTVTGSKSGVHPGRVLADSDGTGASFIPAQRFVAGETVTVATGLNIAGAKNGSYSFQIASPAGPLPVLHWPLPWW